MRASRASLTLCLALPLALAACDTRGGTLSRSTSPGTNPAALSGLSLSAGVLSPDFNAGTLNYAATVGNAVDAISVTASAGAASTVTVNGAAVTAGTPSPTITLAEGANTVRVGVTNDVGQSATYTVVVTREAGTP